ncbi:MAG TPA: glycosyltransferase family 4 protein [Gammaproteobacteria bacterium]|jgi:glycosyltransferase involved in cell wall biosynthesis
MASDRPASRAVCLVVPGPLETATGGYLYDRRILAELEQSGWQTSVMELDASFPRPGAAALEEARSRFEALPAGRLVIVDGLALSGLLPILPSIVDRLSAVALIHHPLADETGIDARSAAQFEAAETAALALVPQVVVTSPWTRRRLADFGVEAERIAVIEPGVDRRRGRIDAVRSDTVRLLTVATVTPRKGHEILIAALARLEDLPWSLRLAGGAQHDPEHADSIRAQVARAGLTDRVAWLGELTSGRVFDEYAAADLFVLPSWLEGYGMALAEAVAHGVPVISTTAGAIPDTVPAAAGRLVPPGDVDALTVVLAELIGDRQARERLQQGARDAADSVPTWAQSAGRFADVLSGFEGR